MALGNGSEAYDFSLFEVKDTGVSSAAQRRAQETEKRREEQQRQAEIIELPGANQKNRAQKKNLKALVKVFGFLLVCALVANLIYCRAVLTELTDEIDTAQGVLAEQESIQIQLETRRSEKYTDEYVASYARNQLGMREKTDSQVKYFNVYDNDVGTVVQENEETNFLLKFFNHLIDGIT